MGFCVASPIVPAELRSHITMRSLASTQTHQAACRAQPACPPALSHQPRPVAACSSSSAPCCSGRQPVAVQRAHNSRRTALQVVCAAAVQDKPTAEQVLEHMEVSTAVAQIINYTLEFTRASETYEVHSWMLLLGILKHEQCTAAKVLKSMGLDDLYGAWHEVLWALNACDGLQPKAFQAEISFADRAYRVLLSAMDFALWNGRKKVQSEDLLLALAAGLVLDGLFPDLKLTFPKVRKAVEKHTGGRYVLPDDEEGEQATKSTEEEPIF